jgi:hypothetical protein
MAAIERFHPDFNYEEFEGARNGEWVRYSDHKATVDAIQAKVEEEEKARDQKLAESAYCVEEFLRKVTAWEGSAEDELAEAIEEAEKLCAALDHALPSKGEEWEQAEAALAAFDDHGDYEAPVAALRDLLAALPTTPKEGEQ